MVLGGESQPLDVGRERRLHTKAQRIALSHLHHTCAVHGCDRPFAWCEIHHRDPWSKGGPTNLNNALPLCGHHHRRAHDHTYDLRHHPDGSVRFHRRT
jgi:predicted restriction endonuclease